MATFDYNLWNHLVIWGYMYHFEKLLTVEPARATVYQTILQKQHKALKSVTLEPIPVTSLHNRRFMSQARRTWHFARSNVFLVGGLIVSST